MKGLSGNGQFYLNMFILLIPLFLIVIIILKLKNRRRPYPWAIKIINRITYAIWTLSFLFAMVNLNDTNRLQLTAAIIFMVTTTLALLVLTAMQLIRLNLKTPSEIQQICE